LIEIGSKTAEKNSAQTDIQTDRQTDRHYENNGHLAVNQLVSPIRQWTKVLVYVSNSLQATGTELDELDIVVHDWSYRTSDAHAFIQ